MLLTPPKSPLCHYYPQVTKTNNMTLLEEGFLAAWLLSAELLYNHDASGVYSEAGKSEMFVQQEAELSLLRVGRR